MSRGYDERSLLLRKNLKVQRVIVDIICLLRNTKCRWRDELDDYWKGTIWQRIAQDSQMWKQHAEAFAQPRDTTAAQWWWCMPIHSNLNIVWQFCAMVYRCMWLPLSLRLSSFWTYNEYNIIILHIRMYNLLSLKNSSSGTCDAVSPVLIKHALLQPSNYGNVLWSLW